MADCLVFNGDDHHYFFMHRHCADRSHAGAHLEDDDDSELNIINKVLQGNIVLTPSTQLITPDDFLCPISLELMTDPVILPTGISYERANIMRWLESGRRTCPVTNQPVRNDEVLPNVVLRRLIEQHRRVRELRRAETIRDAGEVARRLREGLGLLTASGEEDVPVQEDAMCEVLAFIAAVFSSEISFRSATLCAVPGLLETLVCFVLRPSRLSLTLSSPAIAALSALFSHAELRFKALLLDHTSAAIARLLGTAAPHDFEAALNLIHLLLLSPDHHHHHHHPGLVLGRLRHSAAADPAVPFTTPDVNRLRHALALTPPVIAALIRRVSPRATRLCLRILSNLCFLDPQLCCAAVRHGAIQSLLILLQSPYCSEDPRIKSKALKLLRFLSSHSEHHDHSVDRVYSAIK